MWTGNGTNSVNDIYRLDVVVDLSLKIKFQPSCKDF